MVKFVELKHPNGSVTRQPETTARALKKRGWVDVHETPPAKSAPKQEWVDHAVAKGADPAEAEEATKDDLIDAYGD